MHSQINFGYPWWLSYGHLVFTLIFGAILAICWKLNVTKWVLFPLGAITLWGFTAFLAVHFMFDVNKPGKLPIQSFLTSGEGKVLDIGAGTGRSTLMVLEERPHTTVVALDEFGESYVEHFGDHAKGESVVDQGQQALLANMKAAGVAQRVTIQPADMRHIPLPDNSFDAIISSYAIDHLPGDGKAQALSEAYRVLKPNGEFLLMVVGKDFWMNYTFGPLLVHMRRAPAHFWENLLRDAGFKVMESGFAPATKYVLSRKPTS